jgi:hypothetical protein
MGWDGGGTPVGWSTAAAEGGRTPTPRGADALEGTIWLMVDYGRGHLIYRAIIES